MIHLKLMLTSNLKERLFTERERREPILGEKNRWKTTEKNDAN